MILLLGLALNATFIPLLTPPTLEALLDYTTQMEALFVSQPGPTVKLPLLWVHSQPTAFHGTQYLGSRIVLRCGMCFLKNPKIPNKLWASFFPVKDRRCNNLSFT